MSVIQQLSSPAIYIICGVIVAFVAVVCVVFAVRAWRAGKAIGMDTAVLTQARDILRRRRLERLLRGRQRLIAGLRNRKRVCLCDDLGGIERNAVRCFG